MYSLKKKDLYEFQVSFHSIWIKHPLPVDLNVKFKVQLITIIKGLNFSLVEHFLFDNTFKMKYLERILDHLIIWLQKKRGHFKIDALNREAVN